VVTTVGLLLWLAVASAAGEGQLHRVDVPPALEEGRARRALLYIERFQIDEPRPTTFRVLGSFRPEDAGSWQVLGTFSKVPASREQPPEPRRFVVDLSRALPALAAQAGSRWLAIRFEAIPERGIPSPPAFRAEGLSIRAE
jgi:hypothetical protein